MWREVRRSDAFERTVESPLHAPRVPARKRGSRSGLSVRWEEKAVGIGRKSRSDRIKERGGERERPVAPNGLRALDRATNPVRVPFDANGLFLEIDVPPAEGADLSGP